MAGRKGGSRWRTGADREDDRSDATVLERSRRWTGDELVALHDLARFDRHRVPPLHAAVVQPGPVFTNGGEAVVDFRMHDGPDGQWAETEYVVGRTHEVRFEVEVRFGEDAGDVSAGLDVGDWTRRLVDVAYYVVQLVLRSPVR